VTAPTPIHGVTVGRVPRLPVPLCPPVVPPRLVIGEEVERHQRADRYGLPPGRLCGSTNTKSGEPCGWLGATCPHPQHRPGAGQHRDTGGMNAYWLVAVAAGIALWLLIIAAGRGWL
jgi:hypothetical protein